MTQLPITVRDYRPADLAVLLRLFHDTIRTVNLGAYTQAQVEAWAPDVPDLERWRQKLAAEDVVVADRAGELVGFCAWERSGYVDFLYVHDAHQRQGVAQRLYDVCEQRLRAAGCTRLHTQASITAQPFFTRQGFRVVKHQTVPVRGEILPNAVMEKIL